MKCFFSRLILTKQQGVRSRFSASCSDRNSTQAVCKEAGASLLEFAIVIPIITMFIFGFIDIARYWQAKSALSYAAQYGLNIAVVIPNLERGVDDGNDPLFIEARNSLIEQIKSKANQLVLTSWGNRDTVLSTTPEFTFPISTVDYQQTPIEITLKAQYNALFMPLAPIEIKSTVSGFREPRRTQAMPIPVDCFGRPKDLTNSNSALYGLGCPCERGENAFTFMGQCVCSGDIGIEDGLQGLADGTCGCPDGKKIVKGAIDGDTGSEQMSSMLGSLGAVCCDESTPSTCPVGTTREAGGCKCLCPSGAEVTSNGTCACESDTMVFDAEQGACICDPNAEPCTGETELDETTCECKCPGGATPVHASGLSCDDDVTCTCGANRTLSDGACVCDDAVTCGVGFTKDANCQCQCKGSGKQIINNACTCGAGAIEDSGGNCICDPSVTCASPKVKNSSCQCVCPSGQHESGPTCCPTGSDYDSNSGSCACGTGKTMVNGVCKCDNQTPPSGTPALAVQNSSTCSWACPSGTSAPNGATRCCPNDSVQNGNSCTCNDSKESYVDNIKCMCRSDLPACPEDMKRNPNTCECECPANSDANAAKTACICRAAGQTVKNGVCQCGSCSNGMSMVYSSCTCQCSGTNRSLITVGGVSYCAPKHCYAGCTFDGTGDCNCPEEN